MNGSTAAVAQPARPQVLGGDVSRASLFACAGVLAALNAQVGLIFQFLQVQGIGAFIIQLGGISAIIWFAMYAAIRMGFEMPGKPAFWYDVPILAAIVLLSMAPIHTTGRAALLLSATYLLVSSRRDTPERRVALILLALTGPLVWGPALLVLTPQPLLRFDAHLVGFLIGTPVNGNVVRFATGGNDFFIATGCSSIHNMSLALVLWTTSAVIFRLRVDAAYAAWGLAMVALMFTLNIARLAAIGLFPEHFDFLHIGAGAAMFAWAGLLGSCSLAAAGTVLANRRA